MPSEPSITPAELKRRSAPLVPGVLRHLAFLEEKGIVTVHKRGEAIATICGFLLATLDNFATKQVAMTPFGPVRLVRPPPDPDRPGNPN